MFQKSFNSKFIFKLSRLAVIQAPYRYLNLKCNKELRQIKHKINRPNKTLIYNNQDNLNNPNKDNNPNSRDKANNQL